VADPEIAAQAPPQVPPYEDIARGLLKGLVTLFLGAGVNVYGRAPGTWAPGEKGFVPDGGELARHLATRFHYEDDVLDLARVSQYAAMSENELALYDELHDVFASDYAPNSLHEFIAGFPRHLRVDGRAPRYQLVVTTNYDDALERAFVAAGEEYDLFAYRCDEGDIGRFWHDRPGEPSVPVEDATTYGVDLLRDRSVILKVHGAVNRQGLSPAEDTYVITEDDYIEYLAHSNIASLVPTTLVKRIKMTNLLFLGYSMRDWNLRAFLHRVWSRASVGTATWSIQLRPDRLETMFWEKRGVRIFDVELEDFIARLEESVGELAAGAP